MPSPLATVLMPVYNAEPYLLEAIQSIINQTFTNYKFLIINDGSTDKSENMIKAFKDERIQYIKHDTNIGLISTLNEGLDLATGKYIIRMDADDISFPERFEKQLAFMEANPDIDISGTWLAILGTNDVIAHPATNEECKVTLLQNTILGHPSVILKTDSIFKNDLKYDDRALYAEDYKFWADASIRGLKIANLPEPLMQYRSHEAQVSVSNAARQLATVMQIKLWYAQYFFGDILRSKLDLYADFLNRSINSFSAFIEVRKLVEQLKTENKVKGYFDKERFEFFLESLLKNATFRIYTLCVDCNFDILLKSIFDKYFYQNTSMYQKAKFAYRSIQKVFFE